MGNNTGLIILGIGAAILLTRKPAAEAAAPAIEPAQAQALKVQADMQAKAKAMTAQAAAAKKAVPKRKGRK